MGKGTIKMKNLNQIKYISIVFFILSFSFLSLSAFSSNKHIVGKWYDQSDPKSSIELFEDKDLLASGKNTDSTGTWTQLSDGRLKLKINFVLGTGIMLGILEKDTLRLKFKNKSHIFKKNKPKVLSHKERMAKAQEIADRNKPNPTEAQKRDPNYVWNSPYKDSFQGITSLHIASGEGNLQLVKELIRKGAKINSKMISNQRHKIKSLTPLDMAYRANELNKPYIINTRNKELVEFLESRGALMGTIRIPNLLKNYRPKYKGYLKQQFINAVHKADISKIQRLIKQGGDVNAYGLCEGFFALNKDNPEKAFKIYIEFIQAGANINCTDEYKYGPLNDICDLQIARLLLAFGSDPNQKTFFGSALHQAVAWCDPISARLLISYGANINDEKPLGLSAKFKSKNDNIKRTPFELAEVLHHNEMTTLLKKFGGKRAPEI